MGFGVRFRIALAGGALRIHAPLSELILRSELILEISLVILLCYCIIVIIIRRGRG